MWFSVQGTRTGENKTRMIHWWVKLLVLPRDGTRNEVSIKSDFLLQSKAFESERTSEPFVCQKGGGNSVEKMQSRCEKSAWGHARPVSSDARMLVTRWALKSQSTVKQNIPIPLPGN